MSKEQILTLINEKDMYNISPLLLSIINKKNGSIVRLRKHGAKLFDSDYNTIENNLLEACIQGDSDTVIRYYKAGFEKFDKVKSEEEKTLAHIVSV